MTSYSLGLGNGGEYGGETGAGRPPRDAEL
jgi:hypothetical protein